MLMDADTNKDAVSKKKSATKMLKKINKTNVYSCTLKIPLSVLSGLHLF